MSLKKKEAMHPYGTSRMGGVPMWIKVGLIKWWGAGAVYYFIGFNLAFAGQSMIDLVVVIGLAIGLLSVIVIRPVIVHITYERDDVKDYMFVGTKSPLRILLQVGYSWWVLLGVTLVYFSINSVINAVMHYDKGTIALGVEPFLFGLIYLGLDTLWIQAKKKLLKNRQN